MADIEVFLEHAKSLHTKLNALSLGLFKDYNEYSAIVSKITDFLALLNNFNGTDFELFTTFGKEFFSSLRDLLCYLRNLYRYGSPELQQGIKGLKIIGEEIVNLKQEYADILEDETYRSKEELEQLREEISNKSLTENNNPVEGIEQTINQAKATITRNINDKEGFGGLFENPLEPAQDIEKAGRNIKYDITGAMINNAPTSSQKIALYIQSAFDRLGDYVNNTIDYIGTISGNLFIKLGKGVEESAYCIDVLKEKGFDGFLDDNRCMQAVADAIVYTIFFLLLWKTIQYVLRKITGFMAWLSNYKEGKD